MNKVSASLLCSGVLGACQFVTALGLFPSLKLPEFYDTPKGILILVPLGAFLGVVIAFGILKLRKATVGLAELFQSYLASAVVGVPAVAIAPMTIGGLGPHPLSESITSFTIQYCLAWLLIVWLCFYESNPNRQKRTSTTL